MATIDITIEGGLLIATVTGNITANELIAVVLEYYPNDMVKDVIWDLTHGSLESISQEGFGAIAKTVKMSVAGGARRGGVGDIVMSRTPQVETGRRRTRRPTRRRLRAGGQRQD